MLNNRKLVGLYAKARQYHDHTPRRGNHDQEGAVLQVCMRACSWFVQAAILSRDTAFVVHVSAMSDAQCEIGHKTQCISRQILIREDNK